MSKRTSRLPLKLGTAVAFSLLLWCAGCRKHAAPPESPLEVRQWQDEVIYQLLTDRFADGDPENNNGVDTSCPGCYHGGDWRGILERLDYLEALGVTAIWISPIVENADSWDGVAGYHGYWPRAFDRVNPHFGSLGDLRDLIAGCHERGIKVIVDAVVNHLGSVFFYDVNGNGVPDCEIPAGRVGNEVAPPFAPSGVRSDLDDRLAPAVFFKDPESGSVPVSPAGFHNPEWYHRRGQILDFNDRTQALTGDFRGGLRDLDTQREDVREALLATTLDWLDLLEIDGFRWDAAKHVEDSFWEAFLPAVRTHFRAKRPGGDGLFQFAEVVDGNPAVLAEFTRARKFDAVLNFAAKFQIFRDVFVAGGSTFLFATAHRDKEAAFPSKAHPQGLMSAPRDVMVNFIDNHDFPRFLHERADPVVLRAALGYLLTSDGVPVIYYGTEQAFSGGEDPDNREDLWTSGYDQEAPLFVWIGELTALRSQHAALRRGETDFVWTTEHTGTQSDAGILAYERHTASERLLVVINTHVEQSSRTCYAGRCMQVGFPSGTQLVDLLAEGVGNAPVRVPVDGCVELRLLPLEVRILGVQAG